VRNDIIEHEFVQLSGDFRLIAHAGGAIDGWQGSNSLEAMQNAAGLGFRYIELDMLTTTDGQIVLTHDWYDNTSRFPALQNGQMTHADFMSSRIYGHLSPVDLSTLIEFLREFSKPRIIVDTKDTDYAALYAIARHYPEYIHRFIPQIYEMADLDRIRRLGFEDIMLTLYMMSSTQRNPTQIHQFAMDEGLYAVVIPQSYVFSDFVNEIDTGLMRYIVHTIDDLVQAKELYSKGFYGIMTGFLKYDDSGEVVASYMPIYGRVQNLQSNLQNLNEIQRSLLENVMIYQIGHTAYIDNLQAHALWSYYLISAPFENPETRQVYLTLRNFENYLTMNQWHGAYRQVHIEAGGREHALREYMDFFMFRHMVFVSEEVITNVFGFEILRSGDFIFVIKKAVSPTIEELTAIAHLLF